MNLPDTIFESVCSCIAKYQVEGYNTFQILKKRFPSESHKIPTSALVDAARNREQKTRYFLQVSYINTVFLL